MSRKPIIAGVAVLSTVAALTAVGLHAAPFGGAASPTAATAVERAAAVEPVHFDRGRGGGWWRGRGGDGGPGGMLCGERAEERMERMLDFVEELLTLTPPQAEAWQRVTEAAHGGAERFQGVCDELREAGAPETAPERLARIERMADAGATGLREVRTAFDAFYRTLDEQQRRVLDVLATRHGPGRHHGPERSPERGPEQRG
jgi:hypothetical protein